MCPPATARGVAREGSVQLKVALPSLFGIKQVYSHREESAHESCGDRNGSAQAVGHDRGHRRTGEDPDPATTCVSPRKRRPVGLDHQGQAVVTIYFAAALALRMRLTGFDTEDRCGGTEGIRPLPCRQARLVGLTDFADCDTGTACHWLRSSVRQLSTGAKPERSRLAALFGRGPPRSMPTTFPSQPNARICRRERALKSSPTSRRLHDGSYPP
jgi:hypothetical protein